MKHGFFHLPVATSNATILYTRRSNKLTKTCIPLWTTSTVAIGGSRRHCQGGPRGGKKF